MKKIIKALTIGGATLDTIIEYEEMFTMNMQNKDIAQSFMLLQEGTKIEVKKHTSFTGGGATNAAVSFKKQALNVSFFGKIGKDVAGNKILQELKEFDIDVSNIRHSNNYGTATSYVIPALSGDRTIFAYRGANKDILQDDLPTQAIIDSDFIYITSLSKSSAARLPEIVKLASKNDTKVAINPGASQLSVGESFIKDSIFGINILILNYQEAQKLMLSLLAVDDLSIPEPKSKLEHVNFNKESANNFRLKNFFKICLELGPKIIVVTDGSNGVYAATKERIYHSESINVANVVNTLGAGDAFSSTFCANIYKGLSIEEAMKYALINASHVIQFPDAKSGLQTIENLEQIKIKMDYELNEKISISCW